MQRCRIYQESIWKRYVQELNVSLKLAPLKQAQSEKYPTGLIEMGKLWADRKMGQWLKENINHKGTQSQFVGGDGSGVAFLNPREEGVPLSDVQLIHLCPSLLME